MTTSPIQAIEMVSLRLSKRLTAAAIRARGITLEYVGPLPEGVTPSDIQKYLDEAALRIADKLEKEADELLTVRVVDK